MGYSIMMMFEIYTQKSKEEVMEVDIDQILGYPKGGESPSGKPRPNVITERYRIPFKHPTEELWAASVDVQLVDKCKDMSAKDRDKYYLNADLKDFQYLIDNGWFPNDPFIEE